MRIAPLPVLAACLGLAACAGNQVSDKDRLALYTAHAGPPVTQIPYIDPMGWDRIDESHVVLNMRPSKSYLLRLSGPCLEWSNGSPFLGLSSFSGMTLSTFDKVLVPGSQVSCTIQQIRPLDAKAVRAGDKQLREDAKAAASAGG